MDATSQLATVSASSLTTPTTTKQTSTNAFNVNQSNNTIHTHASTHSVSNSLANKTTSSVGSNSNISIGGSSNSSSSNSNSSCSSSSTSSNSSGYGSTTTTPTNNYDLQQTTPTTTPIPITPIGIPEHIIPVATVAAVTHFYNESLTTHNLETHHVQHHRHHPQQHQQLQQQQHHLLQTNHHQFSQNHLQTNVQQQQQHQHQYLPRQQYYSPYDYQQTTPTHNLSGTSGTPPVAPYNKIIPGSYEMPTSAVIPSYGAGQYKSSSSTDATNYERSPVVKTNMAAATYNQQQQQQGEQQQSKTLNQQTRHQSEILASSKQRSSLISNSTNINTSKPQAAATPFYANPTPYFDNFKHKISVDFHDTYSNPSANTAAAYHQQQKYYAAAKSQLKEASYAPPGSLNSKSLYPNTSNFYPGSTGGLNLSTAPYDNFMYSHTSATGYSTTGHLGNETPTEVSNYRKPVADTTINSPSWPWGIDYASGNSRSIPPPGNHLPTATVAPTHATHLSQNPSVLHRDPYYMSHDKYGIKYDKYTAPSYQQTYVSPPSNRHVWSNTPHVSNLTQLNDRHVLATGPPALPSHGIHTTPYFPNNSTTGLNGRQSCCSQPYQPQSCYYPPSHPVPPRLHHNPTPAVTPTTGGYLTPQQTLGQSPHLNALSASCKYGGVLPDYGNGNKIKNANDLYLNVHHYDNNPTPHSYGYGSGHNSQQLYASNAHQPIAHGSTPGSLLTNDPLNANPTSYTNDLSLMTSNFDNYHTHLDTHASQQTLTEIHHQQPPPAYGPTVAKRALLDYRKPIQLQPPPTVAEDFYATLSSRDHYNQQELLNTPETTTIFGEYEANQSNSTAPSTAVLVDTDRERDESNKNLSLRDFIANWNDDEDEYQNNEEMNFDQNHVIEEVLQTASPSELEATALAVEDTTVIKPTSLDSKKDESLKETVNSVESLATTLNDPDANQYVNLPDIVIDIEKSNNVNNSIITPTSSPNPSPQDQVNNISLNLTNFDVEKELDELNLKKPAQQELTKDLNDIQDLKKLTSSETSPCKNLNLTSQLSFEDLNLEPANKTVLNAITKNNHSSEFNEQYFKDIEGYESSSSRHSNESAFEKEYETFINKISSESSTNKGDDEKTLDAEREIDFVQNVHNFSKFYKRKRKLKEDELKSSVPANQGKKKLKTSLVTKVNNSNFPQVYTKKSRNRFDKTKLQNSHPRKPMSAFYKIIHSIRRFGLYREKRVREYLAELTEKHLPLIKRQSIKNYTHEIFENLFNAPSLKALCVMAINTDEFRQSLMLAKVEKQVNCLEAEEKHICIDPTCETCEILKSLMEAQSFETTLEQKATESNGDNTPFPTTIFCMEGNNESITVLQDTQNTIDLNIQSEERVMISGEFEKAQDSEVNFSAFDTKDLEKDIFNLADKKSFLLENAKNETDIQQDFSKTETNVGVKNWHERPKLPYLALQVKDCFEISLQTATNTNLETNYAEIDKLKPEELVNLSTGNKSVYCELNLFGKPDSELETKNTDPLMFLATQQDKECESEDSDSSESDTDSSSSDTEDKSLDDDNKDSYKKSKNSYGNSESDTENDSDDEDELVHSDSNQSYHSKNIKPDKNFKKHMQTFPTLKRIENERKAANVDDSKKETKDFIQTDMQTGISRDSEDEDENISRSPQRIVIRITKSLSSNDHSLRVENIFGKSLKTQAEFDNQNENETKDDDIIAKTNCEITSNTLNLSLQQEDILEEYLPEKSLETQTDNKTKDQGVRTTKSEIIPVPLKLFLKRKVSLEAQATELSVEPNTQDANNSESGSEDNDILEKKAEAAATNRNLGQQKAFITTSLKLSPTKEDAGEEPLNLETDSEIIAITLKSRAIEAEDASGKVQILEETQSQFNKSGHFFNDNSLENSLESHSEDDIEDTISTKIPFQKPEQEVFDELQEFAKIKDEDATSKENSNIILKTDQKDSEENIAFQQTSESLVLTEFENIKANQTEDGLFVYESEKTSDVVLNTGEDSVSELGEGSISEHSSSNTAITLNKTESIAKEKVTQTSKLESKMNHYTDSESEGDAREEIEIKTSGTFSSSFKMDQNRDNFQKEILPKKCTQENIELYDLLDSETQYEEVVESESDKDIYSQGENQDSESTYDGEYETDDNDEILEPIKMLNNPKAIVISDDESMNICETKGEVQKTIQSFSKTSEESLQKLKNIKELTDTKETKESLIKENNEIFIGTQKEFVQKDSEYLNSLLDMDYKLTEQVKHEKEPVAINNWGCEEKKISDSEINITGQIFAYTEIRQDNSENSLANYPSKHSSSSEEPVEEMEEKIREEPLTNSKENWNYNECIKNKYEEDVLLQCSGISELHKEKLDQSCVATSDSESTTESDLEGTNLQTYQLWQKNVLHKSETMKEDSNTLPQKMEQSETMASEIIFEERIEKSKTLLVVDEVINLKELANESYNLQNEIQEAGISDPETNTTKANSSLSGETKNLENSLDQVITEDKTKEVEETIYIEGINIPTLAETCSLTFEQPKNIPKVTNEQVAIEELNTSENKFLESKETTAQLMTDNSEILLEATLEHINLVHSEEINEAANLLETMPTKMSATSEDVNCKNNSGTEECVTISKEKTEVRDSEDTDDFNRTFDNLINKNTETFFENSNISVDVNDQPQNENSTELDLQKSEINFQAVTNNSDCIDNVNNKEMFEEISKPSETTDEKITKEIETITKDTKVEPSTNILKENIENIPKTKTEKLETSPQALNENFDVLENSETTFNMKVVLSSSTTSTKILNENIETISKESEPIPQAINENFDILEDHKKESYENIFDMKEEPSNSLASTKILSENVENIPKTKTEESETILLAKTENFNILDDQIIENSENKFDMKREPISSTSTNILNENIENNSEESETIPQAMNENFDILEDHKIEHFENTSDMKIEPSTSISTNILNENVENIPKTKAEENFDILEDQKKENSENKFDKKGETSGGRSTNILSENVENIPKTKAKESENTPQAITENSDIFKNQNIENFVNTFDHQATVNEYITTKSLSKPISNEITETISKHLEDELKSITEILEETPRPPELVVLISEADSLATEDHKGENLEKIIDKEKSEVEFKEISTTDLVDIIEKVEEYNSVSQETGNQSSDEVIKTYRQTKFIAKSIIEDFENSSEKSRDLKQKLLETFESNDDECGAKIHNLDKSEDTTNLEGGKTLEEESVINHNTLIQAEYGKSADIIEIAEICEENKKVEQIEETQIVEKSETKHQTEDSKPSFNENLSQNVQNKDPKTPDDISDDFFGFKNQSSFEDESEDFHGFEDLEEVTRIRQEIENLKDDSTANDGFLTNLTLKRQMHNSSTSSLAESMSSEINELEALEKELSQHQLDMKVEENHKETENYRPTKTVEVVSSNDIQHLKQMLESDDEQQTDGEGQKEELAYKPKDKSVENSINNNSKDIISSLNSNIPKLSDLCRAALNSSLNSISNFAQQHTETSTFLVERELSVEEALAEMYRQAGVLLSDPEDCDNDIPSPGTNEAHDMLLINLQEILNSDNNEVFVLQCDINENVLNVVQSTEEFEEERQDNDDVNTERVNTVQIILDTQDPETKIHIISSDSESDVIILSDDDSEISYRPFRAREERVTIPFINDDDISDTDGLFDIPTISHEEIVPDNLHKFLQEEFYKYLHEKYVQRNISKYYHANRVLKKYKKRFVRSKMQ